MLERLDPNPEYWEGKRGACVGVFQMIIAGREDRQPEDSVNLLDYHTVTRPGLLTFILRPAEHQPQLHFTADSEAARDAWVEAILQSLPS